MSCVLTPSLSLTDLLHALCCRGVGLSCCSDLGALLVLHLLQGCMLLAGLHTQRIKACQRRGMATYVHILRCTG